ncbi:hypothetical protein IQ35_01015 [Sphingobium wenxiniae]|uniref:Nitronate monooxygenase n=2 Tax=Sphingobium wenxiniae (strain DSM 21828 / CGMCC 1.7748 / JZ-1) TaxID=595605 RepID=A0A562KKI2_SPHWJ|nr:hypothetical protein IQ35_01015 [Sphingobium wenxiniae]
MSPSTWRKLIMADRQLVDELYGRFKIPVIVAPMFLISSPELVIAAARAGIMGAIPAPNARTIEELALWLPRIASETAAMGGDGMWAINMADFAYMGTRFISTPESMVSDDNRSMLVRARMEDIVTTAAVTGVPSNWIRESLDAAGFTPEMIEVKKKIDFSNLHGDTKAWKTIWGAGHGVGSTRRIQCVADIVDELAEEACILAAKPLPFMSISQI